MSIPVTPAAGALTGSDAKNAKWFRNVHRPQEIQQEISRRQDRAVMLKQEAEAERQKHETAEARHRVETERRQAQSKADLARQMAEEEQLTAVESSGLMDQYV